MDETLSNRCRACAGLQDESKQMVSLFETNLFEMFIHCTSLEIASDDCLPSHICLQCFGQLSNFNKFRQDCINSDIYFREQLIKEPIKVEPVDEIGIKCEESETCQVFESKLHATEFIDEGFIKYDPELIIKSTDVFDPIDHLNSLDNTKFICYYCGRQFDRKNEIASHMNKHKREMLVERRPNSIPCIIEGCSKMFASRKTFNEHRLKVHKVKSEPRAKKVKIRKVKYFCTQCPKWFTAQHKLGAHIRAKHEGLKPYKCMQCDDREFCKYQTYIAHMRFTHSDVDNEKYKCSYGGCDKEFTLKCSLRRHIERFHLGRVPVVINQQFICDQCGKSFKKQQSLKKHSYTHSGIRPFACKTCPKAFTTKDKLKIHTMRHLNERPFECPTCGLRKTTQKELRDHLNFHTKKITFPCKECPRVFTSLGAVNRHVRIHHRNHKPYVCPHCERTFAKAETMKYHAMTHTGEKPFACSECGHRFIQAVAMKAHMKVHAKKLS